MTNSTFVRRLAMAVALLLAVAVQALAAPLDSLAANAPPTITGFSPKSGPVGTLVTINGSHFGTPAPGLQVLFNGTAADPETVTSHQITVRVPPLAPSGPITIKTRYGTAVSHNAFQLTRGIASFPRGAWPGETITVAGSGFHPFHDLTLKLDGAPFGGAATNANGEFSLVHILPPQINIGPNHILLAKDQISHVTQKIHIWIFGAWPQPRDDAAQSGDGAAEFSITTSNVGKVHQHYAVEVPFTSPAVEDGGDVFLGAGSNVVKYDPYAGTFGHLDWAGGTDGPVTQSPAVANGVVYAVSDDELYAFQEAASSVPDPLWSAVLGDDAHPFAPVVADGRVYVADGGTGIVQVFDANGVTNCSGTFVVCTPLWFASYATIFGPPAIDAKSAGGNGDVYLSVNNGGVNRVAVRTGAGATVGQSAALASTSLSGPSLGGGRVLVSGWSGGTSTATLYALDASSQALLWSSSDLGGSSAPTAVALGGGHTFVQNSDGTLRVFKSSGCGLPAVCDPLWSGFNYGVGGTTPPTLANGIVYIAAGNLSGDLVTIDAFDANGCGGSVCTAIAFPNYSGLNSQIVVVAGTVFGFGDGNMSVAEVF